MIDTLMTLFWMIVLTLVFTGGGLFLISSKKINFSGHWEQLFFAFVCGEGLAGYALFSLGSAQLLTPVWLWVSLAVLTLLAGAGWMRFRSGITLPRRSEGTSVVRGLLFVALCLVTALGLVFSLTPETGRDALLYHLAAPKLYLENGGFYFIPGNLFAQYPFHTEMLFTLGLFLQGDVLAKGINFLFLLAFPLGLKAFTASHPDSRCHWLLSSVVLLTLPTFFDSGHTAYSDLSTALHVFAAVLAYFNWQKKGESGWLIMSGACVGLALASKYTVLILPFIAFFAILYSLQKRGDDQQGGLNRNMLLFAVPFLLTGAPYYLKNWVMTGNPFYPYLYGLFGGVGLDSKISYMLEGMTMYAGMGRGILDYLMLPFNLSFLADWDLFRFDGVIGPIFLLTLPLLVWLRPIPSVLKSLLVFSAVLFLFWASGSQQMRYLIPVFPFLALATSYVVMSLKGRRALQTLLTLIVVSCLVSNVLEISRSYERIKPHGYLLGKESRDEYLTRNLLSYPMFQYVNEKLPSDAKVFLLHMRSWTFLCERDCYSDSIIEVYTLQNILEENDTPSAVYSDLKTRGFTHLMYNNNYLLGERSLLTKEQKKLFILVRDDFLNLEKEMSFFHLYSL